MTSTRSLIHLGSRGRSVVKGFGSQNRFEATRTFNACKSNFFPQLQTRLQMTLCKANHVEAIFFRTTVCPQLVTSSWPRSGLFRMMSSKPKGGQQKDQEGTATELSKPEQLKRAIKDYGSTVIVFHVAISLISLGGFYSAVSSGVDVVSLLERLPLVGEKVASSNFGAGASTFVIAYAVHKVFAPVRISITLTSTPFIVQYLRRKGVLKVK